MLSYASAPVPVRSGFAGSHQRFWDRLARPGAGWTGAERVAIAHEARAAAKCDHCRQRRSALSPHIVAGRHTAVTDLPDAAVEVAHAVMQDAGRLTRRWYEARLAEGLSDGQYVEIVGTVVALVSIDRFCRAVAVPEHALPAPLPGAPTAYRPARAVLHLDEAWVPMVPMDNADTPEADLWPAGKTGNVIRAMSLVPDEVRTLADLSAVHYLPNERVRDASACQGSLSRPQMELIAGRVSVLHDCFY
jgi:hypothetical protein